MYSHGLGHVINYSTEQRLLMETLQGVWGTVCVCMQEGKLLWLDTVDRK